MMYIKGYLNISSTHQGVSNYNTTKMLVKASTQKLVQFLRLVE